MLTLNKTIYLVALFSVVLTGFTRAMDVSLDEDPAVVQRHYQKPDIQEEAQPLLRILNKTPHKIVVRLQFEQEAPGALTLIEEQAVTMPFIKPMQLFSVALYGKYSQWFTMQTLTFGWYQLPNDARELGEMFKVLSRERQHYLQVTIDLDDVFWGKGRLRSIVGRFLPYKYSYKCFNPAQDKDFKKQKCLLDMFPQVKYARDNDEEVLPRYFLSVPEEATQIDLLFAYWLLNRYWTQGEIDQLVSQDESELLFQFIEKAYHTLKSGNSEAFEEALNDPQLIFPALIETPY